MKSFILRAALLGLAGVGKVAGESLEKTLDGHGPSDILRRQMPSQNSSYSLNTTSCPGYKVNDVKSMKSGLKASLSMAGEGCNAFGVDIQDLTLEVTYETQHRLHVHLYDTKSLQYQLPDTVFPRPSSSDPVSSSSSDLAFDYQESPFAFWISRRDSGEVLFDTREGSLQPVDSGFKNDTGLANSTALTSFPLVFENQYLQLASALPRGANIYGLGEAVASSGFRRNSDATLQTMWARDAGNPVDENEYGSHNVYLEHRINSTTGKGQTHGVFLLNSHGMDVLLRPGAIEYRAIGGTFDFYFVSGPEPKKAIEQYVHIVGLPEMQPYWSFGFHLCRWGYDNLNETKAAVDGMRSANIPLEVMWNDIDHMLAYEDFTIADDKSNRFPKQAVKDFIDSLHANGQYYVPIVDAAIHKVNASNSSDVYDPYTRGAELDVFMKNPNGTEYIGKVWPGYTVFPDWFADNVQEWWTEAYANFSKIVDFDGIWLDMNEPSSFCDGSCGTGANLSDVDPGFILPGKCLIFVPRCYSVLTFKNTRAGFPGNEVTDYPEGYNATISGPSGNITVNGIYTFNQTSNHTGAAAHGKRELMLRRGAFVGIDAYVTSDAYGPEEIDTPPYAIHNGQGRLGAHAVSPNATHKGGLLEYHVHNVWGHMEEQATNVALRTLYPDKRPFIVARSTFAGSGRKSAHWLGDNFSTWYSMWTSIQGILQFQLFGIPMVGADTCGFQRNSDEELCNRWMMLSAFAPFYRNHNIKGSIGQEPFRWDSVAEASRKAIAIRYSLLPYFYTAMADASVNGTPAVRALWWEFPDDASLLPADRQFLFGPGILVTPVLEPNATTVKGVFPGNDTIWRDWYTHERVNATAGVNTTMSAPLSHINLHVRGGYVFLQHATPGYTIKETRSSPFSLLVALDKSGQASGHAYLDDGSSPNSSSLSLDIKGDNSTVCSTPRKQHSGGVYHVAQKLSNITILGVQNRPKAVYFNGQGVESSAWTFNSTVERLQVNALSGDLNSDWKLGWE